MNILLAHQHLGAWGGAEANLLITAEELQKRGHQLGLLYCKETGRSEAAYREVFADLFCLPSGGHAEHIEAVIEDFKPDVIYLHNLPGIEAVQALLDSGVPVVRMVHDHALYCLRTYKYNYFTRHICTRPASGYCVFPCLASVARNPEGPLPVRWAGYQDKMRELELNRQCQAHIVYSEYCRQELIRNGFKPENIHIHVPIRCWENGPVSSFGPQNRILFAGQIIRGKGVDVLLRALAKVKVPFECVILGEGNHRAYCERLSRKLGLTDRVQFKGYVAPEQMRAYYLEASLFVMSSVWPEPFGMAGPEAMRYGLPVVAFDAGGIREWLLDGENGRLIAWMHTDQFARSIEDLLQHKELARQMGLRGRERVMREYDSRRQVSRLESLFDCLRDRSQSQSDSNETSTVTVVHGDSR
jgi:glycosyltransferase involved in cell wall biosynthesis